MVWPMSRSRYRSFLELKLVTAPSLLTELLFFSERFENASEVNTAGPVNTRRVPFAHFGKALSLMTKNWLSFTMTFIYKALKLIQLSSGGLGGWGGIPK